MWLATAPQLPPGCGAFLFDGGAFSCHNQCNIAQEKTLISDMTVGILTRMRERCEEICQRDISAEECAEKLDVITDIMDRLMTANAIEQRALLAKKCGVSCGDVGDAVRRVFNFMEEEEAVN